MRTIFGTIGLVIGGAIAWAITMDWERSGARIVLLAFVLGLAALVTLLIMFWMRTKRPVPPPAPPEPPRYPLSRSGNIVLYTMPGPQAPTYDMYDAPPSAPGRLVN